MMLALVEELKQESARLGQPEPITLAVTVLTSINQEQLVQEMLVKDMQIKDLVVKWALMAQECGIKGVVCSPQEISAIREACGPDFKIVTPGIRPAWSEANDQKRITTPRQALDLGADYMVIGRPIVKAASPMEAALKIIDELEE